MPVVDVRSRARVVRRGWRGPCGLLSAMIFLPRHLMAAATVFLLHASVVVVAALPMTSERGATARTPTFVSVEAAGYRVELHETRFDVYRASDRTLLLTSSAESFWQRAGVPAGPGFARSRLRFDLTRGRWTLRAAASSDGRPGMVAVSLTPDPTQPWHAVRAENGAVGLSDGDDLDGAAGLAGAGGGGGGAAGDGVFIDVSGLVDGASWLAADGTTFAPDPADAGSLLGLGGVAGLLGGSSGGLSGSALGGGPSASSQGGAPSGGFSTPGLSAGHGKPGAAHSHKSHGGTTTGGGHETVEGWYFADFEVPRSLWRSEGIGPWIAPVSSSQGFPSHPGTTNARTASIASETQIGPGLGILQEVPVPATLALLGSGALTLFVTRRRRGDSRC